MANIIEKVYEYFTSLIVGVILLYVLWQVVITLAADIPEFYKYGIAIAIAAAIALVVFAKRGFNW